MVVDGLPPGAVQPHGCRHVLGDRDRGQGHDRLRLVAAVDVHGPHQCLHRLQRPEGGPLAVGQPVESGLVDDDAAAQLAVALEQQPVGLQPLDLGEIGAQRLEVGGDEPAGGGVHALLEAEGDLGDGLAVGELAAGLADGVADFGERPGRRTVGVGGLLRPHQHAVCRPQGVAHRTLDLADVAHEA